MKPNRTLAGGGIMSGGFQGRKLVASRFVAIPEIHHLPLLIVREQMALRRR